MTPISPTHASSEVVSPVEAAGTQTADKKTISASDTVKTVGELKKKSPQFFNLIMKFIATHINSQSQRHSERLKEMIREGDQNAHR